MIKLGRVSELTRGPIVEPDMVEDYLDCQEGGTNPRQAPCNV